MAVEKRIDELVLDLLECDRQSEVERQAIGFQLRDVIGECSKVVTARQTAHLRNAARFQYKSEEWRHHRALADECELAAHEIRQLMGAKP